MQKLDRDMLPRPTHDEQARLDFVRTLRAHLSARVMPGNYAVYEQRVAPAIRAATGEAPQSRHQVRPLMEAEPYYQFWSSLQRCSQELMWDSAIDVTERALPELVSCFRHLRDQAALRPGAGSLRLNPSLKIPAYHTARDIHIQPGGYHTEQLPADDVAAGAVFETGIQAYGWGLNLGQLLVEYFQSTWPDAKLRRLLDIGCTIGSSTLPWAAAFPDAEIQAIDVAAPVLRYAHARAESLGVPVHFSQQDAVATDFESAGFDLVVSEIALHETSSVALPQILGECRRLLRPGGLMLHLEIPRGQGPIEQFMHEWESYNNNESFSRFMTDIDLQAIAVAGGWSSEEIREDRIVPAMSGAKKNYTQGDVSFKVLVGERSR